MSTSRRTLITRGALALVATPMVGVVGISVFSPGALERERDGARREGLPLEPRDLAPSPPVPDADNAGPVLKGLTVRYKSLPEADRDAWEKASSDLLKDPQNAAARAVFEAGLRRWADLAILAEDAASRPRCDMGYDWSRGPELPFPEFAVMRQWCRAFCARALLTDDPAAAYADIARAARLGNHAGEVPCLIAALVNVAIHAVADKAMLKIAQRFAGDPDARALARKTLDAFAPIPDPEFYFRGEVILGTATMRLLRDGKLKGGSLTGEPAEGGMGIAPLLFVAPMASNVWERQLLAFWREAFGALRAHRDDFEATQRAVAAVTERWARSRAPQDVMVAILAPVFTQAITKMQGDAVALRRLRGAALDLLEKRAADGAFPATFDLPLDPFSGQPLRYRREGEGCLLYSVGADHTDDGGKKRDTKHSDQPYDILVELR